MTTANAERPIGRWARWARLGALVHFWAALVVAAFLGVMIVLSRVRPSTDRHGYVLVFGTLAGLVLLMAAAWFWLSAKAIATGSTIGVWAYTFGAIVVCAFGANIAAPVIAIALLVLALMHVYVALRAQREW